jgi:hypothetical protein
MCDPQIDPRRVDPTVAGDMRMSAASTSKDSSGEATRCKVDLCVVYPRNMLAWMWRFRWRQLVHMVEAN